MNTVNQTFSWSRFTAALRKELVENKRTILFTVISTYALLTMFMIFGNLITGLTEETYEGAMEMHAPQIFVTTLMMMFVCVTASLAFKNLKTKTGRISMLCSPVSTLEKFLVNVLIYVAGALVAYLACAHLADLTRCAALWFFRSESFFVPGPMNFLNCLTTFFALEKIAPSSNATMSIILPLSIVASGGLFLMGSILWPRLSALKTLAAFFCVEIGVLVLGSLITIILGECVVTEYVQKIVKVFGGMEYNYWSIGWYVIQILLFWGLAWFLFKRKDVISLKWWK